jgi:hypothetical protein
MSEEGPTASVSACSRQVRLCPDSWQTYGSAAMCQKATSPALFNDIVGNRE